jgi:hypothetical protein
LMPSLFVTTSADDLSASDHMLLYLTSQVRLLPHLRRGWLCASQTHLSDSPLRHIPMCTL